MTIERALSDFEVHRSSHLDDLKKLVRVPSISFPDFDQNEVHRSAEAVAELLKRRGLENIQILNAPGNPRPYVYADWLKAPGKPTVLLYAHHDVQPIGDESKWKSAPFEPTERDGRLYGRGAADDKAGVIVHTAAIASWLNSAGSLPINVKLLIEGEEEIGSPGLEAFLKIHKELVQADVIVLTDTDNYSTDRPGLTVALRGIVAASVEVKALRQSVHSGMWGGPLPDPVMGLCRMLATLTDENGDIAIPGIMDKVRPLSERQERQLEELKESDDVVRNQAGLLPGVPFLKSPGHLKEKIWFRPSITVNAIEASNRKNAANIICGSAWAKVSIRVVPNLDPEDVLRRLTDHLKKNCPWGLELKVETDGAGAWWETNTDHPAFDAAIRAMKEGWGKEPVLMGCGGSIPFVQPFSDALGGAPALLIGVEDPMTYAHSENESLHLGVWENSVKSCIRFYEYVGELKI